MRAKIAPNLIEIGIRAYLSNGHLNPLSKLNSEKVEKAHIVDLVLTNLERGPKIAPNLIKIGLHAYLSNGYLIPLSNFNHEKVDKSAYFQPWFHQP